MLGRICIKRHDPLHQTVGALVPELLLGHLGLIHLNDGDVEGGSQVLEVGQMGIETRPVDRPAERQQSQPNVLQR